MLRVLRSWSSLRRPWSSPSPWSFSRGRISAAASVCARADAEGPSRVGGPGRGESPLCSTGLLSSLSPVGAIGGARTRIIDGFAGWVVRKVPSWRGTVSPSTSTQIVGLARSYSGPRGRTLGPRGRTLSLAVVLWGASNVRPRGLRYDRTTQCTTARIRVRPRGTAYDCEAYPGQACTGCPVRCPQEGGPHYQGHRRRRPRAPMPAGGRSSPACRVVPSSSTFRDESDDAAVGLVQECPTRGPGSRARRPRTDLGAEPDRSRRGTEPISARGTGRATPAAPGITTDRDVSSQFPVGWDARPRRGRPPARRRAPARIIPIDEGALHAGSCREGL